MASTRAVPSDATLNALSASEDSASGLPFFTIGEDPHYTAYLKILWFLLQQAMLSDCLRVYKDTGGELKFGVNAGLFRDAATMRSYAGASGQALTDDATNYIHLTAAGALTVNTTGFPAAAHVPLATIGTGSASVAEVGGYYDFVDITDYRGRAATSVVGDVATRKLVSQALAFGDFVDDGGVSGHIDFTTGTIPAGSIVVGWKAVVATGFTGDTTAVAEVGIAGDTDAYSADVAQSVLAAATVGSAAQALEAFVGAAATPRVTVTGAADWGNVSAGSMTVTVYYKQLD